MIARLTEVERIIPLAQEFFDKSGERGKFNPEFFTQYWKSLIEKGVGCILYSEKDGEVIGIIGLTATEEHTTGDLVLEEHFWYGDARLKQHAEKLGKEIGCKRAYLSMTLHLTPERLSRHYLKTGWQPCYLRHVKEL